MVMLAQKMVTIDSNGMIENMANYKGTLPNVDDDLTYTIILDMNRMFKLDKNRQDIDIEHIQPILNIVADETVMNEEAGDYFETVTAKFDYLFRNKDIDFPSKNIVDIKQVMNSWRCTSTADIYLSHIYRKMVPKKNEPLEKENIVVSLIKEAFDANPSPDGLAELHEIPWFVEGATCCIDARINGESNEMETIRLQFKQCGTIDDLKKQDRCIYIDQLDGIPEPLAIGILEGTDTTNVDESVPIALEDSVWGSVSDNIGNFTVFKHNDNNVTFALKTSVTEFKLAANGTYTYTSV